MEEPLFIDLTSALDLQTLQRVSVQLDDCFLTQQDELHKALFLLGFSGTGQILQTISEFLKQKLSINRLTIMQIEQIDLRKLSYEFLCETGISIPRSLQIEEKKILKKILFKLGRLYIHEVLFPALIDVNPRWAYSIKNLLLRSIRQICRAENFDQAAVEKNLRLQEIEIPQQDSIPINGNLQIGNQQDGVGYIQPCSLNEKQLIELARQLFQDYKAICKKSTFVKLINSRGANFEPMEVSKEKLHFIIHLIHRMWDPYEKKHKPLIEMNKRNKLWCYLQQNITVGGITPRRELRKLSSEINSSTYNDRLEIKRQVKEILDPIYKLQNKK